MYLLVVRKSTLPGNALRGDWRIEWVAGRPCESN